MQVNRIDQKLILRTPTHKWRSNWTKERIRTQAKHQTFDQNNHLFVKCENDYADLLDDNQFKKSMKMLYNQLRSNRNQQRTTQRYKGLGESCLILENKDYQTEEKKNSPNKKLSKFQKILRIRRKGSIFKSCLGKNEQDEQQNYSAIKISSQLYSQDQINSGSDLSKSELSYFLKDSDNRAKLHSSKGGTGLINSSVIHKLLRQNRKCLKQGQMKLKAEC